MAQGIQKIQQQLPFPQQGLSQHFQANELHCIFSQGQKPLQKVFCAFGIFRLNQNSKRNLGHNISKPDDKRNRIPLLQRKEIVKWFQLLPVIKGGSFVTSGWLRHSSSSSSSTGSSPQENRIQIYAAQFQHTMLRFWNAGLSQPNCTLSYIQRTELIFTNALQNTSFEMESHDTNQNVALWGPQVQRNQAPSWKHRPHWKGWNKGWFTAGFILCISWE